MRHPTIKRKKGRPRTTPTAENIIRPKIACKNCRRKFTPVRQDQKFCQDSCRKEFHQYGRMSIAKITERVERRLTTTFGARIREIETQIKTVMGQFDPKILYPDS